jgi:uncharacterized membrane-anchored protein YitT (DUF2179 family)
VVIVLNNKNLKLFIKEGLFMLLGSIVYGIGVEVFLSPLKISPGGITGISAALNFLTNFPTGVYIIAFNLPLVLFGLLYFGKKFIFKTAVAVITSSLVIEVIDNFYEPMFNDKILGAVFGGVLLGVGLGVIMLIGASTGGVDIAVKLLNEKFNVSIGRAFLIIDSAVIIFAAVVYGDFESALYSVVAVFVSSTVVEFILGGNVDSKAFFIISDKEEEVKNAITNIADRGITILPAFGGYTGRKNNILLCVARNNEVSAVRRLIINADPNAFFFLVSAGDVIGKGFK